MALQVAIKPNTPLSAASYLPYSLSSLLQFVHTIAALKTPPSHPVYRPRHNKQQKLALNCVFVVVVVVAAAVTVAVVVVRRM